MASEIRAEITNLEHRIRDAEERHRDELNALRNEIEAVRDRCQHEMELKTDGWQFIWHECKICGKRNGTGPYYG